MGFWSCSGIQEVAMRVATGLKLVRISEVVLGAAESDLGVELSMVGEVNQSSGHPA